MKRKIVYSSKYLISLISILLIAANLIAQPTISSGSVVGSENSVILVPITVDNFEFVNQFRLEVSWDNAGLKLAGVQDAIPGVTFSIAESSFTADYDDVELTLPNGTALFYASFRIIGTAGSVWPVDLNIASLQVAGGDAEGALNINGQVSVSIPPPIIRPQYAEGLGFSNVVVPITVQNFNNINEFNFSIWGSVGATPYIGVQDIYPGVVITPPIPGQNILYASYNGGELTLPDNTILFNVVYQVIGLPGMNRQILLNVSSIQVSGVPLAIPPQEVGTIHIIDPLPITLIGADVDANAGEEVVMPITVSHFTEVHQLNFTLTWDPSVAEYIEPDFLDPRISYFDADGSDGVLQGAIISDPFTSLPNGTTVASLRFLMNQSFGKPYFTISIEEVRIGYVNTIYSGAQTINGSFIQTEPTIAVGNALGNQDTNVIVPITAHHFSDVNQFEFNLDWDNTGLVLDSFEDVLEGISFDIVGSNVTVSLSIDDSLSLSLPDSTVLFNINFNIAGEPGTLWPIDILIASMMEYNLSVNAIGINGEVAVTIPVSSFSPLSVEGSNLSTVLVPITVENFHDIDAFDFEVTWPDGYLTYDRVLDVYPGVIVTSLNNYTLSATYDGDDLTLPDSTVLFYIAFQLNAPQGTDHIVTLNVNAIEAWGVSLAIPPPSIATVHIIDPDPITILAQDVVGYAGQEVVIPITVANFENVSRIFLTFEWDASVGIFQSADFLDPNVNFIQYIPETSRIVMNIYNNSGISLTDGDTLAVLRFYLNGFPGSSSLNMSTEGSVLVIGGIYSGVQVVEGSITSEPPLMLNMPSVSAERFSNINVPMTVFNFQNLNTISFHVRWDPTVMELRSVIFEQATSWDSVHIENGLAFIALNFPAPLTLENGLTLFNLNFELIGEYLDASEIAVDINLPWEVVVSNTIRDGVVFNAGIVSIDELLISGHIRYPNDQGINNVRITTSDFGEGGGTTNDQGYYQAQAFNTGSFLSVMPYKNDPDPLNGLDIGDVSAINNYLNDPANADFKTAYQVIAADVDNDESVSNADIQLLEMILLGDTLLPSYDCWRFIEANHVFTDMHNPYPYPNTFEVPDYNVLLPGTLVDFVGVKRGDVNLSLDNTQVERAGKTQEVTLEVNTKSLGNGISQVEIKSIDFKDIRAYQFTVSWDVEAFDLLEDDFFSMGRYSKLNTDKGHLSTVWQDSKTIRLEDGTTLVRLLFHAKVETSLVQITVTDAITPIRVFNPSLKRLNVNIVERLALDEESGSAVLDIYPNPAISSTHLIIYSSDQQESFIEILDLNGHIINSRTVLLQPGKNELSVDTQLWPKGVYLFKLQTKTGYENRKIIKR